MPTADPKGKKPRIDSEGDKDIESALMRPIEKLQEIQDELDRVDEEAIAKVLEVEQKHKEIRRQVYVRRNEVIKKIPNFWLTAFLSHPILGELLNKADQEIFKHLMDIDVDEPKDIKSGYSITLTFSSNPYFKDTKLTKTCSFSDDGKITMQASSINWKDGMDITNGKAYTKSGDRRLLIDKSIRSSRSFLINTLLESSSSDDDDDELILATFYVAHKQHQLLNAPRHGGSVIARRNREAKILSPTYSLGFFGRSFFTWFNDAKNRSFAQVVAQGVTDEVADIIKEELWPNPLKYFNNEAEDELEEDEEVADIIKEELWPNPLKYFKNEAEDEFEKDEEESDDGDGDNNNQDEEEDDEEK